MDPVRKCYKMIKGMLVETIVADVLPTETRNRDGLPELSEHLVVIGVILPLDLATKS